MRSKQEAIDKNVIVLANQQGRAGEYRTNAEFYCQYLDPQGRKCAVGVHMPDGPWQHDGSSASQTLKDYPALGPVFTFDGESTVQGSWWRRLQTIHDNPLNWDADDRFVGWEELREFADESSLTITVPPEAHQRKVPTND